MTTRIFSICLLVLICSPAASFAQSSDALVQEGLQLRRDGRDAEALARFEQAYQMSGSPQALAQMALAEQALGRFVEAEVHLNQALQSGSDPWIATRIGQLQQALGTIQERLGTLELDGGVPGAEVYVDGELRGTLPGAASLRVRAGTVALEVRAPGYFPLQRQVVVAASGFAREPIQLAPAGSTVGQPAVSAPTQVSTHPNWTLFGAGVALFGVAWVAEWATTAGIGAEGEYVGMAFIPVAGPFILAGNSDELFLALNLIDGLAQVAGVVLAILGLVLQQEDAAPVARTGGPPISVLPWVAPIAGGAAAGLTLTHL